MRIGGREIKGPNSILLVLPRSDGDLVFRIQAVLDFKRYEALCPRPKPRMMRKRGETKEVEDTEDKNFLLALDQWGNRRVDYIIIEALRPSEIEWDTVDYNNPDTWSNYEKDLQNAFFTPSEIGIIRGKVFEANSLTESALEEARNRFLLEQSLKASSNGISLTDAQATTPNGEPVNASGSAPQAS